MRPPEDIRDERAKVTFGMYKFGQGYWVRMMTASMLGILFLAGALWAAGESAAISLPIRNWTLQLESVEGQLAPGDTVTLRRQAGADPAIGTAVVEEFTTSGRSAARLTLREPTIADPVMSVADAREVSSASGVTAEVVRAEANTVFDRIYLQSGIAGLILLVGIVFTYRYVGLKHETVDFLIATDGEMKKVNWSTKKIIWDSTMVVVGATFLIAGLIFVFDLALHGLAKATGLLNV
ncbi:MAG: preprotein translocase subunit SecE [Planctomycetota bacterium]|nr:preprotein translocase subunit SecE [Planctomycetota bacterium]